MHNNFIQNLVYYLVVIDIEKTYIYLLCHFWYFSLTFVGMSLSSKMRHNSALSFEKVKQETSCYTVFLTMVYYLEL